MIQNEGKVQSFTKIVPIVDFIIPNKFSGQIDNTNATALLLLPSTKRRMQYHVQAFYPREGCKNGPKGFHYSSTLKLNVGPFFQSGTTSAGCQKLAK